MSPNAPKGRILVIDDDAPLLEALSLSLRQAGYEVASCTDAGTARNLFFVSKFDLVISDIRLQGPASGVDLLAEFRKLKPVPFVLITGFANLLETKQAFALGAEAFLTKPILREQLLKTVQEVLSNPGKLRCSDEDFVRHPISDFEAGGTAPCDLFLCLEPGRYTRIAQKGDAVPVDKLRVFRGVAGVEYLFVSRADAALLPRTG